ncbi:MAG: type II CAAX prenyl endopeptidase Rce1 family protein [Spirochaetota bacterium]
MKPLHLFLVLTFGLFLVGFAIAGVLIFLGAPGILVTIVQIVMAWTPTMAYAAIHRRVHPEMSFLRFVGDQFAARVRFVPLAASIVVPVLVTATVWIGYSVVSGGAPGELVVGLSLGSFLLLFLGNVIRGPLGEELGWRSYLLGELNQRRSLLASLLLVGVVWGLWHVPLWMVSGYEGVGLLLYSVSFFVSIVAFSVIIGYIHVRGGRNLLYAIALHQMLNFSVQLVEIDTLIVLGGSAVIYVLIALAMALADTRARRSVAASAA